MNLRKCLALVMVLMLLVCGCQQAKQEETSTNDPVTTTESSSEEESQTETTPEGTSEEESSSVENPTKTEEPEPTKPTEDSHEGQAKSYLTGLWVSEAIVQCRPVAIMLNNIKASAPQSNLAAAGVVYEAPVEGGINRLMAIFEDYTKLGNIGSIRSARTYYAILQREWDPIFCHYGQASQAKPYLNENCDNLNGIEGIGSTVYFRVDWKSSPHNAYTTGAKILAGIQKKGYSTVHKNGYQGGPLQFVADNQKPTMNGGISASKVEIGMMGSTPWYEYNPNDGLYYRYQFGAAHVDEATGQPITCKNVLIQYTTWHYYPNSSYLMLDITGQGTGKYLTDGKCIDIIWKKANDNATTHYYDMAGNELQLNQGQTWIHLVMAEREQYTKVYE